MESGLSCLTPSTKETKRSITPMSIKKRSPTFEKPFRESDNGSILIGPNKSTPNPEIDFDVKKSRGERV
jgi:hypothetical protein